MTSINLSEFSSCDYADLLPGSSILSHKIRPVWPNMPSFSGPVYTVACAPSDNLMVHAAIYRAPKGSVIMVTGGGEQFASAGGNVCQFAAKRGIAGFIVDGVVRDIEEISECQLPVYALGVVPKPGGKAKAGSLQQQIICGGCLVSPGDYVVADQNGVIVMPGAQKDEIYQQVASRAQKASQQTLEDWSLSNEKKINQLLQSQHFVEPSN